MMEDGPQSARQLLHTTGLLAERADFVPNDYSLKHARVLLHRDSHKQHFKFQNWQTTITLAAVDGNKTKSQVPI